MGYLLDVQVSGAILPEAWYEEQEKYEDRQTRPPQDSCCGNASRIPHF
jgi:hypothetical protein